MAYEFRITRTVEFADTDMAGIMHFSNFFRYMESTEHAFYRSLGFSVDVEQPGTGSSLGWPRLKAECEYRSPARFEDDLNIHLVVREIRTRAMRMSFHFTTQKNGERIEVALGSIVVVCALFNRATKQMTPIPIPPEIREKLEVAPAELTEGPDDAGR